MLYCFPTGPHSHATTHWQVSNDEEGLLWEEGPNSFQPNDFILQAAVRAAAASPA